MAKTLMVDVDGVLINGRPADGKHLFTDLEADLGLPLATLQAEFFAPHWEAIVTGREPIEERLAEVLASIAPHLPAERLLSYWFENDSRIDEDVLSALEHFRQRGTAIFLATNQEHMRAAYLMETLGLGAHVDGIVYSAELGFRKPAPEFFALAAERAAARPENIVFIDDSVANVEAARVAGWHAVHWAGGPGFREILAPLVE